VIPAREQIEQAMLALTTSVAVKPEPGRATPQELREEASARALIAIAVSLGRIADRLEAVKPDVTDITRDKSAPFPEEERPQYDMEGRICW
jgi:hypothetical protein